ncbi:hypothetical protein QLX08_011013 [Tetragonisca angustula]|uniref:Uncharacterized protein n=1 Tax=Tetragonisca angustula TaxID=166442 RepID=A0AAW0ZBT7_9HYME
MEGNKNWEAVKELKKLCTNSQEMVDVEIIIKEIPVSYQDVAACLPKLWKEYKPMIVIHVGVSHKAQCLTIECCAHSNGYMREDIFNKCPDESSIEPKILKTEINVKQVCNIINENSDRTEYFNRYSSVQNAKGLYNILYCIIQDMKKNKH